MPPAPHADNDGLLSPLGAEDQRRLDAAEGYLALGLLEPAGELLDAIPPERQRGRLDVLGLRLHICLLGQCWAGAAVIARYLVERQPQEPSWWIGWSVAVRHLDTAQTARAILQRAVRRGAVRRPALLHFNLACLAAQLGQLRSARGHLDRAIRLDPGCRRRAAVEPDLEPLGFGRG